eukprot:EG_transcript_22595
MFPEQVNWGSPFQQNNIHLGRSNCNLRAFVHIFNHVSSLLHCLFLRGFVASEFLKPDTHYPPPRGIQPARNFFSGQKPGKKSSESCSGLVLPIKSILWMSMGSMDAVIFL